MTILTDLVYCFIRVHFRRYFSWSEVMLRACLILKMKYVINSNLKEHTYNFVKVSNHWHLKLFSGLVDGSVDSSSCCTAWQPEFDFSHPNRGERIGLMSESCGLLSTKHVCVCAHLPFVLTPLNANKMDPKSYFLNDVKLTYMSYMSLILI